MSISTELTNIRKSVAVFDQILSDSTSATEEFRQQDSVKKIERMQSKIDSVIKILAEKIAPAPIVLNDLNRRRLLNLEDVPGIQIKIPSFSPQGSPNDVTSSNSILDHYTQKDAVDPLVSLLKANPVEENLKLSIEMAERVAETSLPSVPDNGSSTCCQLEAENSRFNGCDFNRLIGLCCLFFDCLFWAINQHTTSQDIISWR